MKLSALAVDVKAIEEGRWVENIPDCDDLRIRTKGLRNAAWNKMVDERTRRLPRDERPGGAVSLAAQTRINTDVLVDACLIDWANLTDDEGKPIAFDKATARKMLHDPKFRRLRDACFWAAGVVADEISETREEDAKNSATA